MATTKTSFGSADDWGKIVAVLALLVAFHGLPKRYGTPLAVAGLYLTFTA
jgi:hypothetical protein